jgi:uncharacterized protein YihD (DUF1040 family)
MKKECNKCDVCSSKNKMSVNDKEYQDISNDIIYELKENESDIYSVLNKINKYHEEKILNTIRLMIDNGIIENDNGILKYNK